MLENNPYICRQDDHLLIASPSGEISTANGLCQCQAYTRGLPCWHRAAARLVKRYDEAQRPACEEACAALMELLRLMRRPGG